MTVVPAISERWHAAVSRDLDAEPFTPAQEALRAVTGDDAVIAYGSTLLLAVVCRQWLVLAQIGDGDILAIRSDGSALLPVPGDPVLDGRETTSLCGPRAADEFRVAIVDLSSTALLGVMLATDGYGNAQLADPWTRCSARTWLSYFAAANRRRWLTSSRSGRVAARRGRGAATTPPSRSCLRRTGLIISRQRSRRGERPPFVLARPSAPHGPGQYARAGRRAPR